MNHMKGILSVVNGKRKMCVKSIAEGTQQILKILQVCSKTNYCSGTLSNPLMSGCDGNK